MNWIKFRFEIWTVLQWKGLNHKVQNNLMSRYDRSSYVEATFDGLRMDSYENWISVISISQYRTYRNIFSSALVNALFWYRKVKEASKNTESIELITVKVSLKFLDSVTDGFLVLTKNDILTLISKTEMLKERVEYIYIMRIGQPKMKKTISKREYFRGS